MEDDSNAFLQLFYEKLIDRIENTSALIWTQAKFYTTIILSLISIPLIIFYTFFDIIVSEPYTLIIVLIFPISSLIIAIIAKNSNKLLFSNLYTFFGISSKIENKLGLNKPFESSIFQKDEYLRPNQYIHLQYRSKKYGINDFVRHSMKRKDNIHYHINSVYNILAAYCIIEVAFLIGYIFIN